MGKQRGDCILDCGAERACVARASVQAFFAYLEQDFVQARVGVDHRPRRRSSRETYFVDIAAELDLVSKETSELWNVACTGMHQRHTCRQEPSTAQQARHADHCSDTKFDLLSIGMARNARIAQA
jgi:hypothetical protein